MCAGSKSGEVVEVRPYDQYVVRIHGSGRLTTRNRKFLKKIRPYCPAPTTTTGPMYTGNNREPSKTPVPEMVPNTNTTEEPDENIKVFRDLMQQVWNPAGSNAQAQYYRDHQEWLGSQTG